MIKIIQVSFVLLFVGVAFACAERGGGQASEAERSSLPTDLSGVAASSGEATEDVARIGVEQWGDFAGRMARYQIYEHSTEMYPNRFRVHATQGDDVISLEVHPTYPTEFVGEYALEVDLERQFNDRIQATIGGEEYVSSTGSIYIEEANEEYVAGSFTALVVHLDEMVEQKISGTFRTEWFVHCHVEADVPEEAPEDQSRIFVVDHQQESQFCRDHVKEALVN